MENPNTLQIRHSTRHTVGIRHSTFSWNTAISLPLTTCFRWGVNGQRTDSKHCNMGCALKIWDVHGDYACLICKYSQFRTSSLYAQDGRWCFVHRCPWTLTKKMGTAKQGNQKIIQKSSRILQVHHSAVDFSLGTILGGGFFPGHWFIATF